MATFSEKHAPEHVPAGAVIPKGVRGALLNWLADLDLVDPPTAKELWDLLAKQVGYAGVDDVVNDVQVRFGEAAANRVADAFFAESRVKRAVPKFAMSRYALPGLTTVPEPLFLDALETAVKLLQGRYYKKWEYGEETYDTYDRDSIAEFNRLFELRGVEYRFTEGGSAEWHGDEGVYQEVVGPALAALQDPRLAASAQEFGDARKGLRQGGRDGEKNAIRDASNSVESAMKALLDDHNVARTGKETADPLWDLLFNADIVAAKTKDAICASPRLRNTYGGHGAEPSAPPVPPGVPAVAVQTAAAALVYLQGRLQ